jgi:plastocyanin
MASSEPHTWYVQVGGNVRNMAYNGIGYYPGVITVDAGDTVVWRLDGAEPHTVTFLGGTPLTPSLLNNFAKPVGNHVYDGVGLHNSGMLVGPHNTYALTFTKPGVYPYLCLMHGPSMAGVVIVQPAGTPYPDTQAQYDRQGQAELAGALAAGEAAAASLNTAPSPGPNGTWIYHVFTGVDNNPTATSWLYPEVADVHAMGQALLTVAGPGVLAINVSVEGLATKGAVPANIRWGSCHDLGAVAESLPALRAGPDGVATTSLIVRGNPALVAIPGAGWVVTVGGGTTPLLCGRVLDPTATAMRFFPGVVRIHVGDTVEWIQDASVEVHTVTFLAKGQKAPEFGTPLSLKPAGGPIYSGTGYFNSGLMLPGSIYRLTFTKPGVYQYLCLVHDNMGMEGTVVVLPR